LAPQMSSMAAFMYNSIYCLAIWQNSGSIDMWISKRWLV
jgi:hypothetical protein